MRKLLFFLLLSFGLSALQIKDDKGELKPAAKELLSLFSDRGELTIEALIPQLKADWMQAKKERWEMDARYQDKWDEALPLLEQLDCIKEIYPKEKHYDYALLLGSLGPNMVKRLDYLFTLWQQGVCFDEVVLLTGARDLDPKREDFPEGLKTETDLLIYLFENHPLHKYVSYTVIDSEKTTLKDELLHRPTTASTILKWLDDSPTPGSCLAISTQPFVGYQEAVVRFFLPEAFAVEAVGPAITNPTYYPLSVYLDNFAKWLAYEHLAKVAI